MIPTSVWRRLTLDGVRDYLHTRGWTDAGETLSGFDVRVTHAPAGRSVLAWGESPAQALRPLRRDYPHFQVCMEQLFRACELVEDRCECRVVEDMARLSEGNPPLPSAEAWEQAATTEEEWWTGITPDLFTARLVVQRIRMRAQKIANGEDPHQLGIVEAVVAAGAAEIDEEETQ